MATTLQSIIEYEPLKLLQVHEGICFGHVMFKMCLYATNDDKVFTTLTLVNAQKKFKLVYNIYVYIWTKKSRKRKEKWA
jgi:hypothetical protein